MMLHTFSKRHLSRIINGDIAESAGPTKPIKTRLDLALVEKYPAYPRSALQTLIKSGAVTVNGTVITTPKHPTIPTDALYLTPPKSPAPKKIPIIYEDDQVLVLDKPPGLLSMSKGAYNPEPTLEDYGLLVHRLDRGTSGVIILAKDETTKANLQKQFAQRKVKKIYHAIVKGQPDPPHAIINIPLARDLSRPNTFRPDPAGRPATTEYELLQTCPSPSCIASGEGYSLLELKPTTGRTHQLRVHLSHINHPILGDETYSGPPAPRLLLHASSLEITLKGGARKTFKSPLPQEFKNVLKKP